MLTKSMQFLKEVISELKRVSWPSKKEVVGSTIVVIIVVIIVAFFVGSVDFFLSRVLARLLR